MNVVNSLVKFGYVKPEHIENIISGKNVILKRHVARNMELDDNHIDSLIDAKDLPIAHELIYNRKTILNGNSIRKIYDRYGKWDRASAVLLAAHANTPHDILKSLAANPDYHIHRDAIHNKNTSIEDLKSINKNSDIGPYHKMLLTQELGSRTFNKITSKNTNIEDLRTISNDPDVSSWHRDLASKELNKRMI